MIFLIVVVTFEKPTHCSWKKIQLGIAEDHLDSREKIVEALRTLFSNEIDVVLVAKNGSDLLEQLKFNQPQIILMDVSMPVMGGLEATLHARDLYPQIKIIVYTQFDSEDNIIEMNKLGVKSFLDKAQSLNEVIKAIRIVNDGGFYFPEAIAKVWNNYILQLHKVQGDIKLDSKECELLKMICQGKSSTEIGKVLSKSPRTIEEHCANLRKKFGVANKEQLIALVSKNNII